MRQFRVCEKSSMFLANRGVVREKKTTRDMVLRLSPGPLSRIIGFRNEGSELGERKKKIVGTEARGAVAGAVLPRILRSDRGSKGGGSAASRVVLCLPQRGHRKTGRGGRSRRGGQEVGGGHAGLLSRR